MIRPTNGTVKKSHGTFTVTRHSKENESKATSSLFLAKMIAKLKRTLSNAHQNKDPHRTPTSNGRYMYIKRYINNIRATTLEQTVA